MRITDELRAWNALNHGSETISFKKLSGIANRIDGYHARAILEARENSTLVLTPDTQEKIYADANALVYDNPDSFRLQPEIRVLLERQRRLDGVG